MGIGFHIGIRTGGVTDKTGEFTTGLSPGLLEAIGKGTRMWGVLPLGVLGFMTTTTLSWACEIVRLDGGNRNDQGQ